MSSQIRNPRSEGRKKAEIRDPKIERRPKSEIRRPKEARRSDDEKNSRTSISPSAPSNRNLLVHGAFHGPSEFGSRASDFFRISALGFRISFLVIILLLSAPHTPAATPEAAFRAGLREYRGGDYQRAAQDFGESARSQPASGTLQNLGNAEWRLGRTGAAILAWERALWLDPFNRAAHGNLRFARRTAQIETPDLAWYEVISSWLPVDWWAWISGVCLWLAVGLTLLPGIFRQRKTAWQQALAAFALMLFLLGVPAHYGVRMRARLGFIQQKDTPLRLTPTRDAQVLTTLAPGEAGRWERQQGNYVLIRTSRGRGWVEQSQLELICPALK